MSMTKPMKAARRAAPQVILPEPAAAPPPPPAQPAPAAPAAPPAYLGDRVALVVWLVGAALMAGLLLKDLLQALARLVLAPLS